jgi:hypothetical protein
MTTPFGRTAEKQAASIRRQEASRLIEKNHRKVLSALKKSEQHTEHETVERALARLEPLD